MPFVITDACRSVKDGACIEVCPCDCIHPTPDAAGFDAAEQLYIDPEHCIDCALCAQECPVNAIYRDDELPPGQEGFIRVNAEWFRQT